MLLTPVLKEGGFVLTLLAISLGACTQPLPEAMKPAETSSRFRSLVEGYKEAISEFPHHPLSDEVLEALLDAVQEEDSVGSRSPRMALIANLPNTNIAVHLLEQEYDDDASDSMDKALQLCNDVRTYFPNTLVAAFAVDKELQATRGERPREFLEICDQIINQDGQSKAIATAFLRRAEYFHELGNPKQAALDYLRFWSSYPEKVERMGLDHVIISCLKSAGLILEADALSASVDPAETARLYDAEFTGVLSLTGNVDLDTTRKALTAAYWNLTPSLEQLLAVAAQHKDLPIKKALFLARIGSLANYLSQTAATKQTYQSYCKQLTGALETGKEDYHVLADFLFIHDIVADNALLLFSPYGSFPRKGDILFSHKRDSGTRYAFDSLDDTRLLDLLGTTGVELAAFLAQQDTRYQPNLVTAVDKYVNVLIILDDGPGIIDVYNTITERFPDANFAPEFKLRLADFYREWDSPAQAAKAYAKLREQYPESAQAITAQLKQGLSLYESEQYDDAYEVTQAFMAEHPGSERIVSAKLLSALCEAATGLREEAEGHMAEIVRTHSTSPLAPRALFWIGSNKLSEQNYDEARETFLDLTERFPDSSYASQARQFTERLASISAGYAR